MTWAILYAVCGLVYIRWLDMMKSPPPEDGTTVVLVYWLWPFYLLMSIFYDFESAEEEDEPKE